MQGVSIQVLIGDCRMYVFFFYEVSALHVEYEEYWRGRTHFFTGVCADVGGAFTVRACWIKSVRVEG